MKYVFLASVLLCSVSTLSFAMENDEQGKKPSISQNPKTEESVVKFQDPLLFQLSQLSKAYLGHIIQAKLELRKTDQNRCKLHEYNKKSFAKLSEETEFDSQKTFNISEVSKFLDNKQSLDKTLENLLEARLQYLVNRMVNERDVGERLRSTNELFPYTDKEHLDNMKQEYKQFANFIAEECLKTDNEVLREKIEEYTKTTAFQEILTHVDAEQSPEEYKTLVLKELAKELAKNSVTKSFYSLAKISIDSYQTMGRIIKILFDISVRDNVQLSSQTKKFIRASVSLHPILKGESDDYSHPDAAIGQYGQPINEQNSRYTMKPINAPTDVDYYMFWVKEHEVIEAPKPHIKLKKTKKSRFSIKQEKPETIITTIANRPDIDYIISVSKTLSALDVSKPKDVKKFSNDTNLMSLREIMTTAISNGKITSVNTIAPERITAFNFDLKSTMLPKCDWLDLAKPVEKAEPIQTNANTITNKDSSIVSINKNEDTSESSTNGDSSSEEAISQSPDLSTSPKSESVNTALDLQKQPKGPTKKEKKEQKKLKKALGHKKESSGKEGKQEITTSSATRPSGLRRFSNPEHYQPQPTSNTELSSGHLGTLKNIFDPVQYKNVNFKDFKNLWRSINGCNSIKTPGSGGSHRSLLNIFGKIVGFTFAPHGGQSYGPQTIKYLREALEMVGFGEGYLKQFKG